LLRTDRELNNMKKLLLCVITTLSMASSFAASEGIAWDKAMPKTNDMASLQNGAKLFVNYCLNCHSAAFMRYNRLKDIGISEQQIKDQMLFTTEKVGETMKSNIDPKQAKEWFGGVPPDLTVITRAKSDVAKGSGSDYVYTLLRSYYRDSSKATGWNNLAYPNIGMPNPLWELQGEREPVYTTAKSHGKDVQQFTGQWTQTKPGALSPLQYDQAVGDLVSYLTWMGEPAQNQRVRVGVWVLIFLGIFTIIAWRLNAAFWKDIK
jgi:ubiquinol-cytochrome c reductase cytochrome c1 subunit